MVEGWHNDDYIILFDEEESEEKTRLYGFDLMLPHYRLMGILGWNEFIVICRKTGKPFCVPTVPLSEEKKEPWNHFTEIQDLQVDHRFTGKIKWHITPIIFGGSPTSKENLALISHSDHVKLVRFWNAKYDELTNKK